MRRSSNLVSLNFLDLHKSPNEKREFNLNYFPIFHALIFELIDF